MKTLSKVVKMSVNELLVDEIQGVVEVCSTFEAILGAPWVC
jgi:hypothetical protein